MPTPEQQREYTRLSGLLMAIGQTHYRDLPKGTVSLSLTLITGSKRVVECKDAAGKLIGTVPNDTTSPAFVSDLEHAFAEETFSDDSIIAIVSNPMNVRGVGQP
jgi:hypothetical protein